MTQQRIRHLRAAGVRRALAPLLVIAALAGCAAPKTVIVDGPQGPWLDGVHKLMVVSAVDVNWPRQPIEDRLAAVFHGPPVFAENGRLPRSEIIGLGIVPTSVFGATWKEQETLPGGGGFAVTRELALRNGASHLLVLSEVPTGDPDRSRPVPCRLQPTMMCNRFADREAELHPERFVDGPPDRLRLMLFDLGARRVVWHAVVLSEISSKPPTTAELLQATLRSLQALVK